MRGVPPRHLHGGDIAAKSYQSGDPHPLGRRGACPVRVAPTLSHSSSSSSSSTASGTRVLQQGEHAPRHGGVNGSSVMGWVLQRRAEGGV